MRSSWRFAVVFLQHYKTDNVPFKVVVIGVAADSGCGKSTFMRRLTSIFGGDTVGPLGGGFENGGWETNSLVSDLTTVLCLDDYHLNDRGGRKVCLVDVFLWRVFHLSCSRSVGCWRPMRQSKGFKTAILELGTPPATAESLPSCVSFIAK